MATTTTTLKGPRMAVVHDVNARRHETRRPLRMLIVEDDHDVRELMEHILEPLGETTTAPDAYQALALVKENRFHVMILDLIMPGATGLELVDRLEGLDLTFPFVIVTAMTHPAFVSRAYSSGARRVLSKPFTPARLRHAMVDAVGLDGADDLEVAE